MFAVSAESRSWVIPAIGAESSAAGAGEGGLGVGAGPGGGDEGGGGGSADIDGFGEVVWGRDFRETQVLAVHVPRGVLGRHGALPMMVGLRVATVIVDADEQLGEHAGEQ